MRGRDVKKVKLLAFALYDAGETLLGALVFSTAFPLTASALVGPDGYALLNGLTLLLSVLLALWAGVLADRRGLRKPFFVLFSLLTGLLVLTAGLTLSRPYVFLALMLLAVAAHQQAMAFYNTLLFNFDERGLPSGLGVSAGYLASSAALLLLADRLGGPLPYLLSGTLFLLLALPAFTLLENPGRADPTPLKTLTRNRPVLFFLLSVFFLAQVANAVVALMGVYLKHLYGLKEAELLKLLGLSGLGGVAGGLFWGLAADRLGAKRVFGAGFVLWSLFLLWLYLEEGDGLLPLGLFTGFSLAHLWSVSRVVLLEALPAGVLALGSGALSLSERLSGALGLLFWGTVYALTRDYRQSALSMLVFPAAGALFYALFLKLSRKQTPDAPPRA
ncbi:MAG: MFS transporter [Aquificae bacterium]|nr:MFS transporter [Aquificota bacterium]